MEDNCRQSSELTRSQVEGTYIEVSSDLQHMYQPLIKNTSKEHLPQFACENLRQTKKNTTIKQLKQKLIPVRICLTITSLLSTLLLVIALAAISLAIISLHKKPEGHNFQNISLQLMMIQGDLNSLMIQVTSLDTQVTSLQLNYSTIVSNQLIRVQNDTVSVNNKIETARGDIIRATSDIRAINYRLNSLQSLYQNCHEYNTTCDVSFTRN